jgi:tripartite ATP-independent transporter DctM subunit
MLIPPSLLLILYGLLTEQSVGDLFIAGVIPGLLLAFVFCLSIFLVALIKPSLIGDKIDLKANDEDVLSTREVMSKGLPLTALIGLVLGGIYGGFFTPIEAGAIGCSGAIVIGLIRRALSFSDFREVLTDTGLVTASISFLIIAAQMYSRMLALSGVPAGFGNFVATAEIGYWGVILAYVLLVILMGTILDSSSIMLILVPLMLPVLALMQVDLIWFGIVTIIAVEIGLLTPPFGISVFVIKSSLDDPTITLGDIFIGAAPFAVLMLIVLGLVLAFPSLVTALL